MEADLGGRAVYGVDLKPLGCWDCRFESRWGLRCSSLVSVGCSAGSGVCNWL